jgi:hypothetical protein
VLAVGSACCRLSSAAAVVVPACWRGFAGTLGGTQPAGTATAEGCSRRLSWQCAAAPMLDKRLGLLYLARFTDMARCGLICL